MTLKERQAADFVARVLANGPVTVEVWRAELERSLVDPPVLKRYLRRNGIGWTTCNGVVRIGEP